MEVVKVKEKDLNLIKEFAEHYTLSDLFDVMDSGRELEFKDLKDRYGYDKTAAIWLGHYEIEKPLLETLTNHYQDITSPGMPNEPWHQGFQEGLMYAIKEIDKRGIK